MGNGGVLGDGKAVGGSDRGNDRDIRRVIPGGILDGVERSEESGRIQI